MIGAWQATICCGLALFKPCISLIPLEQVMYRKVTIPFPSFAVGIGSACVTKQ